MQNYKKLYRSKNERMIAGVCGGIAEYFDQDPTLVRILYVIFTVLTSGLGILIYIIGIIIIPDNPGQKTSKDEKFNKEDFKEKVSDAAHSIKEDIQKNPNRIHGDQIFGLIVLFIGLSILFNNFLPWLNLSKLWFPIVLILIGFAIIINHQKKG